jgi:hypothetical protein
VQEAWADLLAAFRLGRLLSRGGTLIELLVALAVEAIATDTLVGILGGKLLTAAEVRAVRRDYAGLLPTGTFESKTVVERVLGIDVLQTFHAEGRWVVEWWEDTNRPPRTPDEFDLEFRRATDWSRQVSAVNRRMEDAAAAHLLPTTNERAAAWRELERTARRQAAEFGRLALSREAIRRAGAPKGTVADFGRRLRLWCRALDPRMLRQLSDATHRGEQLRTNVTVALALAEYHAESGEYPATLHELTPRFLPDLPTDRFSGRPLRYRRTRAGYLLYSVGVNGRDDGGRGPAEFPPGDDLTIRLPLVRKK